MSHTRSANPRASRFRDRQRAEGLRTVTVWLPDLRDPAYRRRLAAACEELAALPQAEAGAEAAAGLADAQAQAGMAVEPAQSRRGMVVLVRLPGDKTRPAVVLRSDALASLPYGSVVAFTTTPHGVPDLRAPIAPTVENGLQHTCFAMVDWPQTIRAEHLGVIVGRLDPVTRWTSGSGHAGGG